jgi:cell division protein FtsW (lipid II flippase)
MSLKNRNHFLDEVTSQIKSKEAKIFIADELNHHIKETKKSLIQNGVNEAEAEQKAIEHMGSPIQLGMQFNKLHRPRVDWFIVILLVSVLSIGFLPILFSYGYADTDYYLRQKIMIVLIGIAATLCMMFFDYRKIKKVGWLFYILGIIFLLINIFLPNTFVNGVPNITIGPLTIENLMAVPFFFIAWGSFLNSTLLKPLHFIILFFIPVLLFLNIPSISTTFIYIVMVLSMLWWSNLNRKSIAKIFSLCALILSSIGIWILQPERIQRLKAFLDPERYSQGEGYLTFRLKELMSNANMFGNPVVKEFVPQGQTNFVYVFITYYYGWFFAIVLTLVIYSEDYFSCS